jgi:hypothetical protein
MRLFLKIKDFHNNLIVRNWALISMVLIAISLFVSFKHIFVGLGHGIALELVIAALAAAFVIMPTAFLMGHESEKKLKGEKRSAVFNSNLEDYKNVASAVTGVLEDQILTLEELAHLRKNHALLILLGSEQAIDCHRKFINKCQEILEKSAEAGSDEARLGPEEEGELWDLAIDFLGAARIGLELGRDTFDIVKEKQLFRRINEKQSNITERLGAFEDIETWADYLGFNAAQKSSVESFNLNLERFTSDLEINWKKTPSFRDLSFLKKPKVIFYLDRVDKQGNLTLTFAATRNHSFVEEMKSNLSQFNARVVDRTKFDGYSLTIKLPNCTKASNTIEEIMPVIKKYSEEFKNQL